jgi:hypothetical protein
MSMTWLRPALAVGGLLFAAAAQAGTLVQTQLFLDGLTPATFTSSGPLIGAAAGTGAGATWSVGAGAVPGGTLTYLSIPTSAAPPVEHFEVTIYPNALGGSFVASSPGTLAVTGLYRVIAYGGTTLLGIPVYLGTPSVVTPPVVAGIGITAYSNAWTTKTTSIYETAPDAAVTRMGSNGLVNGAGAVVLVSALNVVTSTAGQIPFFAILTLTYAEDAPEPATLLLLGAGVAVLGAIGRHKSRGSKQEP